MKQTLFKGIQGTGVLFVSLTLGQAMAQQYQDDNAWHQSREQFYASQNWRHENV